MISAAKSCISLALLLPGIFASQLYMQPSSDEKGHFTNDSFFITCFTTDESIDHLTWNDRDDNEIKATVGRIHVQPATGAQKGLELVFESVQKEDAGTYVCSDSQNSISFDLIVYKSISFANTQTVQFANEGENAMIECIVKADPTPIVNWYYNGSKIVNTDKYKEEEGGLIITEVTRNDTGFYKCKAFVITNLGSQVKELDIKLEVQYAPEMSEEKSVVYASFGSDANLTCAATAKPEPMFYWRKNKDRIYNSSDHMILSNAKESVLHFKITDEEQFGMYTCEADNAVGVAEMEIELKEGNVPLPPRIKIIREDQGALILSLEEAESDSNELVITGYKVEYKLSSESWDQAATHEFTNGDEFVLRNLSYNSEYILRAAARNGAGYSEPSETIEHTTLTFQVAPVVADKAVGISLSLLAFLLNVFVLFM